MKSSSLIKEQEMSWNTVSPPIIGKDLLELLSSAMYVEPITIYREYIQNSIDSVDEARETGLLSENCGLVKIEIVPQSRTIRIKDNGVGIRKEDFEQRLTAFGSSLKRGSASRGFRGVGRLVALGYCQELIFRSKSANEKEYCEMRWDCRSIKQLLRSPDAKLTLQDIINRSVSVRYLDSKVTEDHFFEVELNGVIRHKSDELLNNAVIYDYLSEIAPVPYHPKFSFHEEIVSFLSKYTSLSDINIWISGIEEKVYRPYRDDIDIKGNNQDQLTDIETFLIPALDENISAAGWVANHQYKGTITNKGIRGIRVRSGNIQIGNNELLQELFGEPRFNSWSLGEIHIIDQRLVPNGRRDQFEQNSHFDNFINHLSPHLRKITNKCRTNSIIRNRCSSLKRSELLIKEKILTMKQDFVSRKVNQILEVEVEEMLKTAKQILSSNSIDESSKLSFTKIFNKLEKDFLTVKKNSSPSVILNNFSASKREVVEQIIDLIYECSPNLNSANNLVKQIVAKLE